MSFVSVIKFCNTDGNEPNKVIIYQIFTYIYIRLRELIIEEFIYHHKSLTDNFWQKSTF
jgi:hypothetical protein